MKQKLLALLFVIIVALMVGSGPKATGATIDGAMIWTHWDADHYALVDDGEAIWIGSGSGLIRWEKASGNYRRISTTEGLPHRRVFSLAVDDQGNLWCGGDGGLSQLTQTGEWRHYDVSNSGIFSDSVDGIAHTADGSVWMSHAESLYVSRLQSEGSWSVYPSRQTAVASAYDVIKETLNPNKLWAVAGDEIWVGYDVFNGTDWETRGDSKPIMVAVDGQDRVWALEAEHVYSWDAGQWAVYPYWYGFTGQLSTLVVDENDGIWVGGSEAANPYSGTSAVYGQLPDTPGGFSLDQWLDVPVPIVALWPTAKGMWGTGPNWLLQPDNEVTLFTDVPAYQNVRDVLVDRHGGIWLISGGALQKFDDKGTATMVDDHGEVVGRQQSITALEPAENGDIWLAWREFGRVGPEAGPPTRYHQGNKIEYLYQRRLFIDDIFAPDGQHTWFVYWFPAYAGSPAVRGIWSLDDGGTPAYFEDDVWVSYPLETGGENGVVAVQNGNIWYGDSSGLYRYNHAQWEQVSSSSVRGLVPGADGELYVDINGSVLVIERNGTQWRSSIPEFVAGNLARVQLAKRRNRMWTVAADGGVWYWQSRYEQKLARRDEAGLAIFETPVIFSDTIAVDKNNHVWLADGALWRMSPEPDFAIAVGPETWLAAPNESRSGLIYVASKEGYQEPVDLVISGLPDGVTATINPQTVIAGQTAVLMLTTKNTALGETTVAIEGTAGTLKRQRLFRLAVVEDVTNLLLPVIAQ